MLREAQEAFAHFVLTRDATGDAARSHVADGGLNADERLAIYRNNVMGSLIEVLGDTFPAVARHCGPDNFEAVASAFVRECPPPRAQLSQYGDAFPRFLDSFEPAKRDLPFLPDLARLEWALNDSYFAAEALSLSGDVFASVPPDQLGDLTLIPHPAMRLVRSDHPVWGLWRTGAEDEDGVDGQGTCILIVRPEAVVDAVPISIGDHAFVEAASKGQPLGSAVDAGLDAGAAAGEEFDFQTALGHHLMRGTFCGAELTEPQDEPASRENDATPE